MLRLVLTNLLYWSTTGSMTPFFAALFMRKGFSPAETGILLAVMPFCSIIFQPIWASIADRLGRRKTVLVCLILAAACAMRLVFTASGILPLLVVGQLLEGFGYMGIYYSASIFVQEHARKGYEARAQGILSAVMIGWGMGLTNVVGGLLTGAFGTATTFLILAAVSAAGICIVWLQYYRKAHRAVV